MSLATLPLEKEPLDGERRESSMPLLGVEPQLFSP